MKKMMAEGDAAEATIVEEQEATPATHEATIGDAADPEGDGLVNDGKPTTASVVGDVLDI